MAWDTDSPGDWDCAQAVSPAVMVSANRNVVIYRAPYDHYPEVPEMLRQQKFPGGDK